MIRTHGLHEIDDTERVAAGDDLPYDFPEYRSTALRAPHRPLLVLPGSLSDHAGPVFGEDAVSEADADLPRRHAGEPMTSMLHREPDDDPFGLQLQLPQLRHVTSSAAAATSSPRTTSG